MSAGNYTDVFRPVRPVEPEPRARRTELVTIWVSALRDPRFSLGSSRGPAATLSGKIASVDDGAGSAAEAYDPPAFIADFSHLLFEVAGDHFDPHGQHLIWTQGFTGGYHPANPDAQPREYSRKFGWEGPTTQERVWSMSGSAPAA